MENSKLISNEPLKLLNCSVQELKKLWKNEHNMIVNLKTSLKHLKELLNQ